LVPLAVEIHPINPGNCASKGGYVPQFVSLNRRNRLSCARISFTICFSAPTSYWSNQPRAMDSDRHGQSPTRRVLIFLITANVTEVRSTTLASQFCRRCSICARWCKSPRTPIVARPKCGVDPGASEINKVVMKIAIWHNIICSIYRARFFL